MNTIRIARWKLYDGLTQGLEQRIIEFVDWADDFRLDMEPKSPTWGQRLSTVFERPGTGTWPTKATPTSPPASSLSTCSVPITALSPRFISSAPFMPSNWGQVRTAESNSKKRMHDSHPGENGTRTPYPFPTAPVRAHFTKLSLWNFHLRSLSL